jgi:hypothetical protein
MKIKTPMGRERRTESTDVLKALRKNNIFTVLQESGIDGVTVGELLDDERFDFLRPEQIEEHLQDLRNGGLATKCAPERYYLISVLEAGVM